MVDHYTFPLSHVTPKNIVQIVINRPPYHFEKILNADGSHSSSNIMKLTGSTASTIAHMFLEAKLPIDIDLLSMLALLRAPILFETNDLGTHPEAKEFEHDTSAVDAIERLLKRKPDERTDIYRSLVQINNDYDGLKQHEILCRDMRDVWDDHNRSKVAISRILISVELLACSISLFSSSK